MHSHKLQPRIKLMVRSVYLRKDKSLQQKAGMIQCKDSCELGSYNKCEYRWFPFSLILRVYGLEVLLRHSINQFTLWPCGEPASLVNPACDTEATVNRPRKQLHRAICDQLISAIKSAMVILMVILRATFLNSELFLEIRIIGEMFHLSFSLYIINQ